MEKGENLNFEKEARESVIEEQVDVSSGFNRRKFIKTVIVTAPVILTVTSRPVFAGSCSESGQLSGNISGGDEVCSGEGCSPGYWKNHPGAWSNAYLPGKSFNLAFGIISGGPFENMELMEVLWPCDIPLDNDNPAIVNLTTRLGFQAVAALQNAATDIKFPHTTVEVKNMILDLLMNNDFTTEEDKDAIEALKDYFDRLNNDWFCPN